MCCSSKLKVLKKSIIMHSALKVKMNGLLMTEMVQISSESEFDDKELVSSLCYQVQDFKEVYETDIYKELHMRTDEEAKIVTSRDDKVRKSSFFAKFS